MLVAVNERGLRIGEGHPQCKLTDIQVDTIRELHNTGSIGYTILGRIFGVSRTCIKKIVVCEKRWQTPAKFKKVA
jgi:hypothetical protein